MKLNPVQKKRIQQSLLKWYDESKRDLPWRRTQDPYAIWVSEIMLQQTQVDTVIPYYSRWLKKFSTIEKLAKANEKQVLKLWEGLGYYSRARNLHKGAQMVLKKFNGRLPQKPEELASIPGIGPYTLGAVSSIAFELPVPAVDGNVLRVLSRLFLIKKNIKDKETFNSIRSLVAELFPKNRRGDMTQAWMELGATLCTPVNPNCRICPVQKACRTKQKNLTNQIPLVSKRPKTKKVTTAALILRHKDTVLLEKRPAGKIMGGLWLFPTVEFPHASGMDPNKISGLFHDRFQIKVKPSQQILKLNHSYTVYRAELNVFEAEYKTPAKLNPTLKWIKKRSLKQTPFPSVHAKIAKFILN